MSILQNLASSTPRMLNHKLINFDSLSRRKNDRSRLLAGVFKNLLEQHCLKLLLKKQKLKKYRVLLNKEDNQILKKR